LKEIKKVNDESFQKEVLDSDQVVLVKFGADFCGPCKMITQNLEEMLEDEEGLLSDFKVVAVDVEESVETAPQYAIRSIPTLIFMRNGKVVGKPRIGAQQRGQLVGLIVETQRVIEDLVIAEEESKEEEDLEENVEEGVDNEDE
jgi:thioredoxin 1